MESFEDKKKHKPYSDGVTGKSLVLHNDNKNTFDNVIDALCKVCDFEFEQAEQCALIAHYKGSYIIKRDLVQDLLLMQKELEGLNLTATIE